MTLKGLEKYVFPNIAGVTGSFSDRHQGQSPYEISFADGGGKDLLSPVGVTEPQSPSGSFVCKPKQNVSKRARD